MRARSFTVSLLLMAGTVAAGLAVRFAPLGLPPFWVKYGGSALWALAIYWLVTTMLRTTRPIPAAFVAASLAVAIEFFKLYRSPAVDAFRGTLPGVLLLGRHFSGWDILAYGIAIAAGALVDATLRAKRRRPNGPS